MVGVVEEKNQVTETDQGVGAVPRAGQGLGVAVHVADHVDPVRPGGRVPAVRFATSHAITLECPFGPW
ncbi:hypothetical protein GCM10010221_17320 [Streptomyces parvus]|nr:hypothetical protein GCM10010221_17320 [Streptomyces parvus]